MNSSYQTEAPLRGIVNIEFDSDIIADDVKSKLSELRKNIQLPGFRPGKVNHSVVEKKYGAAVRYELAEEKAMAELRKLVEENNIEFVAGPVRHDLKMGEDGKYEFKFIFALAPDMKINIDESISLPYYEAKASKEDVDNEDEQYRYSTHKIDEVEDYQDNDRVEGTLVELNEDGTAKEGGLVVENAMMMPRFFKDDDQRKLFEGAKVGGEVRFNPYVAHASTPAVLADLLHIDKEAVEQHKGDFAYTINKILRHVPSELNEEFYKKIFGEETGIKDEESYRKELTSRIEMRYKAQSDDLFRGQLIDALLEKAGKPELDKETITIALTAQNQQENKAAEPRKLSDEDYEMFVRYTYYDQMMRQNLKANGLTVPKEEVEGFMRDKVVRQMMQYGYPIEGMDELIDHLVKNSMEDQKQVYEAEAYLREATLSRFAQGKVTLQKEEVTAEELQNKSQAYYKSKHEAELPAEEVETEEA